MLKFLLNAPLQQSSCSDIDTIIKILHILEYICRAENDCSVSAIVRNVEADNSQISKWLESLVESGYIIKDQHTDLYYPTLKTASLGNCIVNNIRARKFTSAEIKKRFSNDEAFAKLSITGITEFEKIGGAEQHELK